MICHRLQDALHQPEQVEALYLKHQGIERLADIPWERFHKLRTLDLSENAIQRLPKRMQRLPRLRWLSLGNNRLTSLPDWLGGWAGLRHLYVFQNRLRDLPDLPPDLEVLNAQDNQLRDIPRSVADCPRLLNLYLGKNPIKLITVDLRGLSQLRILDLSRCALRRLPALPASLSKLDINRNKVARLCDNWPDLIALEGVDLSFNPLILRTNDFTHLGRIRYLYLIKTKARLDVPTMLSHCPLLEDLLGGVRTEAQALFTASFVQTSVHLSPNFSRLALWDIWNGQPPEQLPVDALWRLISEDFPLLIRYPAAQALLRRHGASVQDLYQHPWWIAGKTATEESALRDRLARHGIQVAQEPTGRWILGYREASRQAPTAGTRFLTERKLLHHLDRREGRELTFSRDEQFLRNLRKMQTSPDDPLAPWLHFLRSSGVPDLLLPELLEEMCQSRAGHYQLIERTVLPYLPFTVQLTLDEMGQGKHRQWAAFPKLGSGSLRDSLMRVLREAVGRG